MFFIIRKYLFSLNSKFIINRKKIKIESKPVDKKRRESRRIGITKNLKRGYFKAGEVKSIDIVSFEKMEIPLCLMLALLIISSVEPLGTCTSHYKHLV